MTVRNRYRLNTSLRGPKPTVEQLIDMARERFDIPSDKYVRIERPSIRTSMDAREWIVIVEDTPG